MTQSFRALDPCFEAETYSISMRNDLNLIYTLSNLIKTLTKIDSQESQELALTSADAIYRTATGLQEYIRSMYEAQNTAKAKEAGKAAQGIREDQNA